MGFGHFITNIVHTAGKIVKPVTNVIKPITRPIEKGIINPVSKAIINPVAKTVEKTIETVQHIPVVGQVFNLATGVHIFEGMDDILRGKRIDKAILRAFKHQMKEYTDLAPYAASIVSFVPAVGPEVGAAIAAAGVLAEGRPLSEVAIAAVKGAVPGGAIAQTIFNVTQAAIRKKKIDEIVISGLPIDQRQKDALRAAIALTKDLAAGKRVDKALMARINDATKILSPEIQKAVNIGSAVGIAKTMQNALGKAMSDPNAKRALASVGLAAANADKVIAAARSINPDKAFHQGFDLASGLMKGAVNPTLVLAARSKLTPTQKKGFDSSAALHIGRMRHHGKAVANSPKRAAAHLITMGIAGADVNQKVGLVKELAKNPETKEGAADAIRHIASSRDQRSIWQIIKSVFGFKS